MIDFIRITYKDKSVIEPFIRNPKNFDELMASLEYHSGDIRYPLKVSLENMEIVANDKVVYLKNSLHKLHNILNQKGDQNFNDFSYSSICETVDFLLMKLPYLQTATITQLEFGLNINTLIPSEKIIRNNILMHQFKGYSHNMKFNGKGEYKQFDHCNYLIKIYDKAKQFKQLDNILRFEIKFVRKREFNKLGILKITDLKSKDKLNNLFNYLIKRFDEFLVVDSLESKNLPAKISLEIEKYLSSNFWLRLSERKYRNKASKHKKLLFKLLKEYDLLNTKDQLRELLLIKFNQLINS